MKPPIVLLFLASLAGAFAAEDPAAILARAETKMQKAGELAQKREFGPANAVIAEAFADYDLAVATAPESFEIRRSRGMIYGQLPPFLGKAAVGRQDLEWVTHHEKFAALPTDERARTYLILGLASHTQAHFAKAVELAPDSKAGQRAAEELARMKQPPMAFDGAGRPMPDRFPAVSSEVSPLMAAATITLPGENITKERMAFMTDAMKSLPGLLGTHLLQSVDQPGMAVLLTWWKDKVALNNFFYGEIHRSFTNRVYAQPARSPNSATSQVAVELFSVLPAGSRVGGGLVPEDIFQRVLKTAVK
ncbi:MAG: hypothetical protein ABI823_17035 [Bryobacteraceae bacterium]